MGECTRLLELQFSDLMIWEADSAYLRHVVGYEGPVTPVPDSLKSDVSKLSNILLTEYSDQHEFFINYDSVPYRVAKIETIDGNGYFLRRPRYPVPELKTLGFKPAIAETLLQLGKQSGMILFSGATGSGKSTTIYSLLQEYVNRYGNIVIAVEDPPEIPMQGAYGKNNKGLWYQIDARKAGGYENAMIAAMRYNPRYIFIGEIRSAEVAQEAIRAAVNGHLVLATIHGNSTVSAILALQQIAAAATNSMELARSILSDGLLAVVHQQLLTNPAKLGERVLVADMLCIGQDMGLKSKLRAGKLEFLSSDIEHQRLKIAKNIPLA